MRILRRRGMGDERSSPPMTAKLTDTELEAVRTAKTATLDQFLEQFVEGYLLQDLQAMKAIPPPPGEVYGAVVYPLLMTALSGIELLGVLTSTSTFDPENGRSCFVSFWKDYVYADGPASQRLGDLVYEFIRHPLAHSFLTKPMIVVTKSHDPGHLGQTADGVFHIDALTLADDFEAAYKRLPTVGGSG